MNIIWTKHAEDRLSQWERKLDITRAEMERLVATPAQTLPGDLGTFVAQGKRGDGLLRVPFAEADDGRKILTVYWTSKTAKYWKEE